MKLRDHERAIRAHEHVSQVKGKEKDYANTYGALCHKLPILIHTAGLASALHFVAARGKKGQKVLLDHLAKQLEDGGLLPPGATGERLLTAVREADLARTQAMTREIQRCLAWYKRFARVVLEADATMEEA